MSKSCYVYKISQGSPYIQRVFVCIHFVGEKMYTTIKEMRKDHLKGIHTVEVLEVPMGTIQ